MTKNPIRLGFLRVLFGTRVSRTVGAVLFLTIVLGCIFVPVFSSFAPEDLVAPPMQPPSWTHPFGTDVVGRDVFVRTFAGGRIDLIAGLTVVACNATVGTLIGTAAGSTERRWIDSIVMRIIDAILSVPMIVLLLVIVMVVGSTNAWGFLPPGLPGAMIAMILVGWAFYARLSRGQALVYRNSDFVVASRIAGLSQWKIVTKHIFPGVGRLSMAHAIGDLVASVVLLASLPFLGAGVQPPNPEWGSIMYEGRGFLAQAWWITICPGVVLALTGLGLSFLADSFLDSREK